MTFRIHVVHLSIYFKCICCNMNEQYWSQPKVRNNFSRLPLDDLDINANLQGMCKTNG